MELMSWDNSDYITDLKEKSWFKGFWVGFWVGAAIVIYAWLLSYSSPIKAQCPDICTEAITLNLCNANPGDVVCLPEICNGQVIVENLNLINWYCDDENGGNPSGCSSSTSVEHDFWIRLQVCQDWVYTIGFDSDYTNIQYSELSGAQMWIYDDCGTLNMIETALCDLENETYLLMDVYLEAGEYVVQVDGYGQSVGCGIFCVYMQGFLGLSIAEILQNKIYCRGITKQYNTLGQRVR